jgi:hypothetical protein
MDYPALILAFLQCLFIPANESLLTVIGIQFTARFWVLTNRSQCETLIFGVGRTDLHHKILKQRAKFYKHIWGSQHQQQY